MPVVGNTKRGTMGDGCAASVSSTCWCGPRSFSEHDCEYCIRRSDGRAARTSGRTFQLRGAVVEEDRVRDARGDGDVGAAIDARDEDGAVIGGNAEPWGEGRISGRVLGAHEGDGGHDALLNPLSGIHRHLRDAMRCVQAVKPIESASKE